MSCLKEDTSGNNHILAKINLGSRSFEKMGKNLICKPFLSNPIASKHSFFKQVLPDRIHIYEIQDLKNLGRGNSMSRFVVV
jgi:hypothetical protein